MSLYNKLRELLLAEGDESPFGDGEFWVVDDDWGGYLQKVYVFKIQFLTRVRVRQVQDLLRSKFARWGVMVQLDIGPDGSKLCPPEGLVIFAERLQFDWNIADLKRQFGRGLDWN